MIVHKTLKWLYLLLFAVSAAKAQEPPNARRVRNITSFCKLFGYIRYFHPSDEAQTIDWERLAIYGSRYVLDAPDDRQLLDRLRDLFLPAAPSVKIFPEAHPEAFSLAAITPKSPKGYKDISWQYSGMSMRFVKEFPRPKDATVRLNRSSWSLIPERYDTAGYAMITQGLPSLYQGGKFMLKASMKVLTGENATCQLGLTNVTPEGQGNSYTVMCAAGKDTGWKEYALTGDIDSKSQLLYLGITLRKEGILQVRDVQLAVVKDGQTYAVPVENNDFSQSDSSGSPSGWVAQTGNNYTYTVKDHFLEIAYIDSLSLSRRPDPPLFPYKAAIGEYIKRQLVPGIDCIVPLVLYGNEHSTYPAADPDRLHQLQERLAKESPNHEGWTADLQQVRLGDIVIAWNIYRHFFPFWKDAGETPDQILHDAIVRALDDRSPQDFFRTLQLMTAPLNDAHIFPAYERDSSSFGQAPIYFAVAEGEIVVKDVLDQAWRNRIQPGDIVDSINGRTARAALAEIERYLSGSPQEKQYMGLLRLLRGYLYAPLHLTLQRGSEKFRIAMRLTPWMDWHSMIQPLPSGGSELARDVWYVNLLDPEEKVKAQLEKVAGAKAVIFDMRGYPSFDLFETVMSHLTTEPLGNPGVLYDPQIVYPDFEKVHFTLSQLTITPKAPQLKGKIYFLSDAGIGSHPEYFLAVVKSFRLGTIIGQATAGVDGTINGFYLPGGYELTFSGIKVAPLPDTKSHLQGVLPDIAVQPGLQAITAGRDEILDQAIKIAAKNVN